MYLQQESFQREPHSYTSMGSFNNHGHNTSASQHHVDNRTSSSAPINNESASSILYTVKEQEAQFERLTRELEAERQSVADQLEQYKIDTPSESVQSLNSPTAAADVYTNYAYTNGDGDGGYSQANGWRDSGGGVSPTSEAFETQDNEFTPGSVNLVDSCLRELGEKGLDTRLPLQSNTNRSEGDEGYYDPYGNEQNGDDDRVRGSRTPSEQSEQGSYRHPYGKGMIRSNANYNISASTQADYIPAPYHQLEPNGHRSGEYRQPPPIPTDQSQISEGDYLGELGGISSAANYSTRPEPSWGQQNGVDNQTYEPDEQPRGYHSNSHLDQYRAASQQNLYSSDNHPHNTQHEHYSYDHTDQPENLASQSHIYPSRPYSNADMQPPQRPLPRTNNEPTRPDLTYDTIPPRSSQIQTQPNSQRQSLGNASSAADKNSRPPELSEVIDFLRHPNDAIKSNAAAYLQHICYGNNRIKEQTRQLRGIPALVNLLSSDIPEVHRNALGALLNLSRSYENDDNKRAIKSCGGIEALAALLGNSRDNDVRELITGLLWNLSSLTEIKRNVIESAIPSLVKHVIYPASGLPNRDRVSWSTEFRNATGVLRNVSSAGPEARTSLRQAHGLVDALIAVAQSVIQRPEMDNKPVENVVCTLRNLSFRLMEVDYPDFYNTSNKSAADKPSRQQSFIEEVVPSCFGKSKKEIPTTTKHPVRTGVGSRRGEQLWQLEMADIYLPLLSDCSNTDTLEAAVGAIQNLTACDWQPSIQFREHVRKKMGLPIVVELLGLEEADAVVCGAAIALRNLAVDRSNRTLIGKYATSQLVSKLPLQSAATGSTLDRIKTASEETIRAVIATLHEVFKHKDVDSSQHASVLVMKSDGVERIMSIAKSHKKYTFKTLKATHQLLVCLWRFSSLRDAYKSKGFKEIDFLSKSMSPRATDQTGTMSMSSTLTRSRSELPSNSNTLNTLSRPAAASTSHSNHPSHNTQPTADAAGSQQHIPPDSTLGRYASNGTLPIQRPPYQPTDYAYLTQYATVNDNEDEAANSNRLADSANSGAATSGGGGYQRNYSSSYYAEDEPDQHNQTFNNSSQSLVNDGIPANYGQPNGEPLYARVEKRRTTTNETNIHTNHSFINPGYNSTNGLTASVQSLHDIQPEADSWV